MRLVPWFLAGVLLLVARAIASAIPTDQRLVAPQAATPDERSGQPGQEGWPTETAKLPTDSAPPDRNQTARGDCQVASSAVVTIHAGKAFGSGSIISPQGLVITNNHVIRPAKGREIGVRTATGGRYQGRVVATDPVNDLALVKLDTQDSLPNIRLAEPQAIQMGEPVCAIGSPFGRPGVLTRGTLTSVRRNGDLQSALLLQPGNSGGPLLNQQGEMIGVNKAIWQSRTGINSGISFATRIDVARRFIEQNGEELGSDRPSAYRSESGMVPAQPLERPKPANPGFYQVPSESFSGGARALVPQGAGSRLGVVLDKQTLSIQQVEAVSAAGVAGLQAGDRLVSIDGIQLQSFEQLQAYLSSGPNSAVFTIKRNQQIQTVQVNF